MRNEMLIVSVLWIAYSDPVYFALDDVQFEMFLFENPTLSVTLSLY